MDKSKSLAAHNPFKGWKDRKKIWIFQSLYPKFKQETHFSSMAVISLRSGSATTWNRKMVQETGHFKNSIPKPFISKPKPKSSTFRLEFSNWKFSTRLRLKIFQRKWHKNWLTDWFKFRRRNDKIGATKIGEIIGDLRFISAWLHPLWFLFTFFPKNHDH